MAFLRAVLAGFIFYGVGLAGAAERLPTGIPFLDSNGTSRGGDLVISGDATSALRDSDGPLTLTGVPLVSGQASTFVLEPADNFSDGPTFYSIKSDGTSQPLNLGQRRTWYGTDPLHPDRAIFISSDPTGRLRSFIQDNSGAPPTVILPASQDAGTYTISTSSQGSSAAPLCEAVLPPGAETTPPSAAPRDPREPRPMLQTTLRLDVSHELYLAFDKDNERIADYIMDVMGATNLIFRRDVQLHWDVRDVVIWTERPYFELPREEYYEIYGTSDADLNRAAGDILEKYRLYYAAFPAAAKRGCQLFLYTHPGMVNKNYIGVLGSTGYAVQLLVLEGFNEVLADADAYVYDTWNLCHSLGHAIGADHTMCYTPPIDCCVVQCNCSSATPQTGTIMSYCYSVSGGGTDMHFHPRVLNESIWQFLDQHSNSPHSVLTPFTTASLMTVHGVKDTYISPGSLETTATTLRATPDSGPVQQTFVIRNIGTAQVLLTATPPVAISGNSHLTIVSQPDKTVLEEGESTSFIISYDPADGTAAAQVSIPTNVPAVPDYSFSINGTIVVPSAPMVTSYSPGLAIPENLGHLTQRRIEVTGVPGMITDIKVRFDGSDCSDPTKTGVQHTNVGDLQMALVSPEGTMVWLMVNPGNSTGNHFCNTVLADDESAPSIQGITSAGAPYTGTFRPAEALSAFIGEYPNGLWRFYISDTETGHTGILHNVTLEISGEETASVNEWSIYN